MKRDSAVQNPKSLTPEPVAKSFPERKKTRGESKAMARRRSFAAAASARAAPAARAMNQASITSPAAHGIRFIQAKGTVPLFLCGTQCPQRPRSSSFSLVSVIYTFHGNYFSPSRSTLRSLFSPSLAIWRSSFSATSLPTFQPSPSQFFIIPDRFSTSLNPFLTSSPPSWTPF